MSIRKVVAGLLITAGIAIMAVPFFWRTTGEKQTEQLIREFEQTLEDDYDAEYLESLKQDIADYKKVNRYISDFKLEGSSNVKYKTLNGQKYATILGLYYIREGSGLEYSYTKFTLREDAQGHWKLLYWELADESDINE